MRRVQPCSGQVWCKREDPDAGMQPGAVLSWQETKLPGTGRLEGRELLSRAAQGDDFELVQSKVTLLGAAEDLMLPLPRARTVLCPCNPPRLSGSPKPAPSHGTGPLAAHGGRTDGERAPASLSKRGL